MGNSMVQIYCYYSYESVFTPGDCLDESLGVFGKVLEVICHCLFS